MSNDHEYTAKDQVTPPFAEEVIVEDPETGFNPETFRRSLLGDVGNIIKEQLQQLMEVPSKKRRISKPYQDIYSENNTPGEDSLENETDTMSDLFARSTTSHHNMSVIPSGERTPSPDKDKEGGSVVKQTTPVRELDIVEDILTEVDKEMPATSEMGPAIKENLAKRVVAQFRVKGPQAEIKRQVAKNYLVPVNCKEIAPPKINKTVLSMKSFTEYYSRNEKALYDTQSSIQKVTSAVVSVANALLIADEQSKVPDTKFLVKTCLDAVTLLGAVSNDISNRRKNNIRPTLQSSYRDLCNNSRTVAGEFLLGDDLNQGMKQAQEASKLQNLASTPSSYYNGYGGKSQPGNRHAGYSTLGKDKTHRSNSTTDKKHFLERGKNASQDHKRRHHHHSNKKK